MSSKSLQTVTEKPEYKLLFLKAIKLGIMYGQSDKANFYQEKIDYEINELMNSMSSGSSSSSDVYDNTSNLSNSNNRNVTFSSENQQSTPQYANTQMQNINAKKYDLIILNLENQRNTLINYINQLSANYSLNHSKINFLKSGLENINKEIEKNKTLKQSVSPVIKKNITEIKNKSTTQNQEQGLTNELQETFNKITELISFK